MRDLVVFVTGVTIAVSILASTGCTPRRASDGARDAARADSATSSVEPLPPPDVLPDSVTLEALGTEPFWNVEVTRRAIVYRDPENPRVVFFADAGAMTEAGMTFHSSRADSTPGRIEIDILPGPCSDGMSDTQYPLSATVRLDGRLLKGCARWKPPRP